MIEVSNLTAKVAGSCSACGGRDRRVLEITLRPSNAGVVVRLCNECRDRLITLLRSEGGNDGR